MSHWPTSFEFGNNVTSVRILAIEDEQVLTLSTPDVQHTLRRVNPCKAAGLDGVSGQVLKEVA